MEMNLIDAWHGIKERLGRLDFDAIWPGFRPCPFALYNEAQVCLNGGLIPRDERFFGNTAIHLDGEFIAIWMLEDETADLDSLTASLVHEMFHAFQMQNHEQRFPDDLAMLMSPQVETVYAIKQAELRLIAGAAGFQGDAALEALASIKALRGQRRELLGSIILQEYKAETIEGLAVYAELCALGMLDGEKLRVRTENIKAQLLSPGELMFDTRHCTYYTGVMLAGLASRAGIAFFHPLGQENETLFELIAKGLPAVPPPPVDRSPQTAAMLRRHLDGLKAQVEDFLAASFQWVEQTCEIIGYDPMNMVRVDDLLLMKTIVMLDLGGGAPPLRLEGKTLLAMVSGSPRQVLRYARQQ